MITLHNHQLTAKEKQDRLCILLTRLDTLITQIEKLGNDLEALCGELFYDNDDLAEEIQYISFEFQKINKYGTIFENNENPEDIDNMLYIVYTKLNMATSLYQELF